MDNMYKGFGAIIGDICGSRYEFDNWCWDRDVFTLPFEGCWVTDDTIHTLATMSACVYARKSGNRDKHQEFCNTLEKGMHIALQDMYKLYPNMSYGSMFRKTVREGLRPYNSYGNGAAMRVSPVAFIARDEQEVLDYAEAVTRVTHNHSEGIKGAQAIALACWMALHGDSKDAILEKMKTFYEIPVYNDLVGNYSFNETCQGTVPQALACFFDSDNFADCLDKAIQLGGDTDTLAAIACSIAGIYYQIPQFYATNLQHFMDGTMRYVIKSFYNIADDTIMPKCSEYLFND